MVRTRRQHKIKNKATRQSTFKYKKYNKRGGKPLTSGSYGCIFSPALLCKGSKTRTKGVSKLMTQKDMLVEMEQVDQVKKYITDIPNNSKYFLVSETSSCLPELIGKDDLENFDSVCGNLVDDNYHADTVNKHISDLGIINAPYGGIELGAFFHNLVNNYERNKQFVTANTSLIDLFTNGILLLNKRGFLHNDIKDDNILIDDKLTCRLIDFGLGCVYNLAKPQVCRKVLCDYSIVFNRPFSSLLFQSTPLNILEHMEEIMGKTLTLTEFGTNLRNKKVMLKVAYLVLIKALEKGEDHHQRVIMVIPSLLDFEPKYKMYKNMRLEKKTDGIIVDYLREVLMNFVAADGEFQADQYFDKVYRHNSDIWGYLMIYEKLIQKAQPWLSIQFVTHLQHIFKLYCYSSAYAVTPIPLVRLLKDLNKINETFVITNKTYTRSTSIKSKGREYKEKS
jgi:hypothetical protein